MSTAESRNHARNYLRKAQEYLASAEDNLNAARYTPAAGDAIHAGISAKDATVTALTDSTRKSKSHAAAAKELREALGKRPMASSAERALRDLIAAKSDVEYGAALVTAPKAELLTRRARALVQTATQVVKVGG